MLIVVILATLILAWLLWPLIAAVLLAMAVHGQVIMWTALIGGAWIGFITWLAMRSGLEYDPKTKRWEPKRKPTRRA